jgi:putative hydrolase of the HAD superfamily
LKSAYWEIASFAASQCPCASVPVQVLEKKAYEAMLDAYQSGENAFDALNTYLGVELPITDMLEMYRRHKPVITLNEETRITLDRLKAEGVLMGIVSDGRELTQWNKVKALGLTEWMDESCIIINSSSECFKPNSCGFERFISTVKAMSDDSDWSFTYVGDNLQKDFIWPKRNGWRTICIKDDGNNIHSQDFENTSIEALPDKVLESVGEL